MGEPEVPPLRDTSAEDHAAPTNERTHTAAVAHLDREVHIAAYEEPAKSEPRPTAEVHCTARAATLESTEPTCDAQNPSFDAQNLHAAARTQPEQVVVEGEVTPAAAGEPPHILVHIIPELASGQPVDFRGTASLMLLDPSHEGPRSRLARWDFSTADLEAANDHSTQSVCLDFPLQVPADAVRRALVEIWVRLLPNGGGKLLAHATVDFSRICQFSSAAPQTRRVERVSPLIDYHVSPTAATTASGPYGLSKSGWQVARPDRPNDCSPGGSSTGTGWRMATEPVPTIASRPTPRDSARFATPPMDRYRDEFRESEGASRDAPEWSPERADDSKPVEPAWSPTR
jgi:hypothetical protein